MSEDQKKIIEKKLKTYDQISETYGTSFIYRTAKTNRYYNKGIPTVRKTDNIFEPPKEYDSYEPIWYACSLDSSLSYNDDSSETYKYLPLDEYNGKPMLFLDLTGIKISPYPIYLLDIELMQCIYDAILESQKELIEDNYLVIDKNFKQEYEIDDLKTAYGYTNGTRYSQYDVDRWFTLELFRFIKRLKITDDCIFMGYFHANLKKKEVGTKKNTLFFQAAEFAIPWAHTVSKYIECESLVATESKVLKTPLPCKKQDRTKKRERTPTSNKQNKKRRVNGGFKTRNTKKRL